MFLFTVWQLEQVLVKSIHRSIMMVGEVVLRSSFRLLKVLLDLRLLGTDAPPAIRLCSTAKYPSVEGTKGLHNLSVTNVDNGLFVTLRV